MPSSKILKICKIESAAFAKYCLMRGADYLGVHVIEFALDEQKQQLCKYIAGRDGRVVVLTKEKSPDKLRMLAEFYKPWALQLHYPIDLATYKRLESFLDIPIVPVFSNRTDLAIVQGLLEEAPFAIYDTSFLGGTGHAHSRAHLQSLPHGLRAKVLLAGGVTPDLIETDESGVGGYDVQSYCRERGRHHYAKAEQILTAVKGVPRRQLSVSLTDVTDIKALPAYTTMHSLEYQVDYSTGGLYDGFVIDPAHVKQLLTSIDAPFTLHIFERDAEVFQSVIAEYMGCASNNIVRINLQYSPGLRVENIDTGYAKLCMSVYYRDLAAYIEEYPELQACISIILSSELAQKQETLSSEHAILARIACNEVWFDRKMDKQAIKLVLGTNPNVNFIVGNYILRAWEHDGELNEVLGNA